MYSRTTDFHLQAVRGSSCGPPGSPVCWSWWWKGVPGTADAVPALVEHGLRKVGKNRSGTDSGAGKPAHYPDGIVPCGRRLGQGYLSRVPLPLPQEGKPHGPSRKRFPHYVCPLRRERAAARPQKRWQEASRETSTPRADPSDDSQTAAGALRRRRDLVSIRARHWRVSLGSAPHDPRPPP